MHYTTRMECGDKIIWQDEGPASADLANNKVKPRSNMKSLEKIAGAIDAIKGFANKATQMAGQASHVREVAALGALAAPSAYHAATGKEMNSKVKDGLEVGGLGALAIPYARNKFRGVH